MTQTPRTPPSDARLKPGDTIGPRCLTDVTGRPLVIPDPTTLVHLQFRRFAGCPVCDLHLRSIARRHAEIEAAGVREVAVFHSSREVLSPYVADLPFTVLPDPRKALYVAFGVEAGRRALTSPAAWPAIASGVTAVLFQGRRPPPPNPEGGRLGLPADFLIAADGRLVACRYGEHAYDQWSVDEILSLAHRARLDG